MSPSTLLSRNSYRTLDEVQEALVAPFPDDVIKYIEDTGFRYIPAQWIKQRMLAVLGADGFDVQYSEVIHHEDDWITVCCTIKVDFSIWGGRPKEVNQSDGIKIARYSKGDKRGEIVDLGDSYKSLKTNAFVKAAQELGVGLYLALNPTARNSGGSNSNRSNSANPATVNQKNAVERMEKKIGINNRVKQKLFERLFSNKEFDQAFNNPTYDHMDRYFKTLKPICDIMDLIQNNSQHVDEFEAKKNLILSELEKEFDVELKSYISLLTLADQNTVSLVESFLKKSA